MRKWTEESILDEASKYSSLKDFRKNSRSAYVTAHNMGILDKIKLSKGVNSKYTLESCLEVAKRYTVYSDFIKENKNVYRACQRNGWIDEVSKHMDVNSNVRKDNIIQKSKKYTNITDFRNENQSDYNYARTMGFYDELKANWNHKSVKWTYDKCKNLVSKYSTLKEFINSEKYCYSKIKKEGWVDLLSSLV